MNKSLRAFLFIVIKVALIAVILFVVFHFFIGVRICRTADMYPNIRDGDLVILLKTQDVTIDDVILYTVEGQEHYGRIVAVAGERVLIDSESGLTVNDNTVYNSLPYPTEPRGEEFTAVVPENSVFVLGDCRDQCSDSRDFGSIEKSNVIGKQIYLMRWRGF